MTPTQSWNVFDPELPVLTYEYSFGLGTANALAVGAESGLIIASPPYRAPAATFEELTQYGTVRGLIATNAFHFMGIAEWKERFPLAEVYAPEQSIDRVQRKTKLAVKPLAHVRAIAGLHVDFIDMPHYRTGEALIKIRTSRGLTWYVTDIILNIQELPKNPLLKFLFTFSGSAPGLRYNNVGPRFMVRDLPALKKWLDDEYAKDPPRWLIPAHGAIADLEKSSFQR